MRTPRKTEPKPKLTDAERHKRFVELARNVGADESPDSFDRAFAKVVRVPAKRAKKGS